MAVTVSISNDTTTEVGFISANACQKSAKALARLTKSIYSCKNVLYKGRRKYFLANLLAPAPAAKQEAIRLERLKSETIEEIN